MIRNVVVLCVLPNILVLPTISMADINQWEWIDLNDHSLGRQESNTRCPSNLRRS